MQKIISLFKRDYEGNRQVYDEVVPGAEWVLNGEGGATEKYDGTSCLIRDGRLYKRYDRKLTKAATKRSKRDAAFIPSIEHFKPAPAGWEPAEPGPDKNTGHWPGWLLVDFNEPENQWHKEAWENLGYSFPDGTYELIGSKIQGNPYGMTGHMLVGHGWDDLETHQLYTPPPRTFDGLKDWFAENEIEGIVWHHPDGRMVKIKRRDFGLDWPISD